MSQDPIVITSAVRTPIGGLQGMFAGIPGTQLGSIALAAAVQRGGVKPEDVQEVIMGCVLPAGLGQAPARQAVRGAGLPDAAGATTINKVCGSGLKAVMLANDLIKAESAEIVLAGGMESMSNAPYLLPKARGGYRFGHGEVLDHMALDGLEDAYEKRTPMGLFAERCVERYGFTRQMQDEFALSSLSRAKKANEDGSFDFEVVPVEVQGRKGSETISRDEQPFKASPEKIPSLKPAFKKDGTVTAANASSISDGASALLLMRLSQAEKRGIKPLARVVGHATHSRLPSEFTIAPVYAISNLLGKIGWTAAGVDLWEINEAFACVTMASMVDHKLPAERVNVHGGACALGHPIGASGARILTTLIGALRKTGGKRGIASLCIGGGEAVALAVEMI
ncbi:acetyl-CoA C-acetyltransferase [Solimonas aquatica]|uniref:Acetyl-CoA C-acetyltransferase n=1 Tax=Solimonas aquatica TaxID=489703 RepID=A0A1H9MAM2_9GAMM|nr:acetyl-CoA C-acyltransferase [Solimonas aquatica]SER20738.1 acetyl-CoA C-acetyltransferase [Solimonas aquatica]